MNPQAQNICNNKDENCNGMDDGCMINNVPPDLVWKGDAKLLIDNDTKIDTDTGAIDGIKYDGEGLKNGIYFTLYQQTGGQKVGVFVFKRFQIEAGITLDVV